MHPGPDASSQNVGYQAPPTNRARVLRGPPSPTKHSPKPGTPRSLDFSASPHCLLGLFSLPQGQHLGPYPFSISRSSSPSGLGPSTLSTSNAPPPSPHPLGFISMQAQAAQTQGDCSSCVLRVGGWEQAAHTPWQPQATGRLALPRPSYPHHCPASASIAPSWWCRPFSGEKISATQGDPWVPPVLPVACHVALQTSPFLSELQVPLWRGPSSCDRWSPHSSWGSPPQSLKAQCKSPPH